LPLAPLGRVAKSKAAGEERGEEKALHAVILRLGEKRFGTPNAATRAALEAIGELAKLEALSLRLLEVGSWDELLPSA